MAIVNKLTSIMPAFGNATEYVTKVAQNLPNTATTVFTLTGFVNYIRSGRLRIKSTVAGTGAITSISITGTDGTLTVQLKPVGSAVAASTLFDYLYDFISDLNLTTITITIINGAGTDSTLDFEVTGNP
jgi:fatty acid-binding protein DegV